MPGARLTSLPLPHRRSQSYSRTCSCSTAASAPARKCSTASTPAVPMGRSHTARGRPRRSVRSQPSAATTWPNRGPIRIPSRTCRCCGWSGIRSPSTPMPHSLAWPVTRAGKSCASIVWAGGCGSPRRPPRSACWGLRAGWSVLASCAACTHNVGTARTPTTDPDQTQEGLAHRVLHDPLTDLPNRTLFLDRLELALARLRRSQGSIAVLFIDLDNFKVVNDSLGHNAGDRLLVELAGRLRSAIRPSDTIARFGGDEFVVLCEDISDARDAVMVGQRIVESASDPFMLEGREMFASASVGVALALDPDSTPETLLRDADAAMYRAKERGRGRVEVFDEALRARIIERLDLENGLRRALQRDELRVYYQPQMSMSQGRMVAVEALVRWEHPERGLLEPAEFIPLAEETGIIVGIGAWVLREACKQVASWRANGAEIDVAVNVSARQLTQPDIVDTVRAALEETGLPADALCLEITESAVMRDPEATLATLTLVKELGVKVALDDFGVGFSSLAQLKEMLPLHAIKVDRSFISGLADDDRNSAIVAAVVMMATTLGLTAIAEGVETEAQALQARALGCDVSQGFFFTAPEPAALIAERLGGDGRLNPVGAS